MKVTVDEDMCRGHGVCSAVCPEVFSLTDDGYSEVIQPDVPPALAAKAQQAARSCPEHAITATCPKPVFREPPTPHPRAPHHGESGPNPGK